MKLSFYLPIKPWVVTQEWGISNPAMYSRFGFTRHNGQDLVLGYDKTIYAPCDGQIITVATQANGKWQPNGGGVYLGLVSKDEYDFPDGKSCRVLFDFLHLERILQTQDAFVSIGTPLAIQDNSGFSTGPHTHIQPRRCTWDGITLVFLDKNDANGSFDMQPYWNGLYAKDYAVPLPVEIPTYYSPRVQPPIEMVKAEVSLLTQIVAKLTEWFNLLTKK